MRKYMNRSYFPIIPKDTPRSSKSEESNHLRERNTSDENFTVRDISITCAHTITKYRWIRRFSEVARRDAPYRKKQFKYVAIYLRRDSSL